MTEKRKSRLVNRAASVRRQMNREGRAFADLRLDREPGIVARQDMFDNGQAKACALLRSAVLDIDAVEALGDARDVLLGYAGTEVPDGDVDARFGTGIAVSNRHYDTSTRLSVFAGVFQQVFEDLEKLVA